MGLMSNLELRGAFDSGLVTAVVVELLTEAAAEVVVVVGRLTEEVVVVVGHLVEVAAEVGGLKAAAEVVVVVGRLMAATAGVMGGLVEKEAFPVGWGGMGVSWSLSPLDTCGSAIFLSLMRGGLLPVLFELPMARWTKVLCPSPGFKAPRRLLLSTAALPVPPLTRLDEEGIHDFELEDIVFPPVLPFTTDSAERLFFSFSTTLVKSITTFVFEEAEEDAFGFEEVLFLEPFRIRANLPLSLICCRDE